MSIMNLLLTFPRTPTPAPGRQDVPAAHVILSTQDGDLTIGAAPIHAVRTAERLGR